jgi:hypothetical protein
MFTWADYHGYSRLAGMQVEDLNRMTRAHADREFVAPCPKKKLIWFSPLPISPIFLFKFLSRKFQGLQNRLGLRRRYRRMYGRKQP